jgi:hypothetical protein
MAMPAWAAIISTSLWSAAVNAPVGVPEKNISPITSSRCRIGTPRNSRISGWCCGYQENRGWRRMSLTLIGPSLRRTPSTPWKRGSSPIRRALPSEIPTDRNRS